MTTTLSAVHPVLEQFQFEEHMKNFFITRSAFHLKACTKTIGNIVFGTLSSAGICKKEFLCQYLNPITSKIICTYLDMSVSPKNLYQYTALLAYMEVKKVLNGY